MKELIIQNNSTVERHNEPVRVAVPCKCGEFAAATEFAVKTSVGDLFPVQSQVLKKWPDQSVKWLLVDFLATVPAATTTSYLLVKVAVAEQFPSAVEVLPGSDLWCVETGVGQFKIDAQVLRPFIQVTHAGQDLLSADTCCPLLTQNDSAVLPKIDSICLEDEGPLHAIVVIDGHYPLSLTESPRFKCRLHFYASSMSVAVELTLHNPQAAQHPGGLWDLGDPGSLLFKGLKLSIPLMNATDLCCKPEPNSEPLRLANEANFSIYQESSGGEHWKSPGHRNRNGDVPHKQRGYRIDVAGRDAASGLRATPLLWCGDDDVGVSAAFPSFWQEFPKELAVRDGQLQVALFPACYPDLHELQGGEQKTNAFWLDFSGQPNALEWVMNPLQVAAAPDTYSTSRVLVDLPGETDLVDRFTSPTALHGKRELIDEYGWRNFGEIYADHEAVGSESLEPFISHYNNQYDFLAGAYRKAFATADGGWRNIACDMAKHVRDIDIYHTDLDREEYNHGLHWHTDHYLAAGLSTHRSCSREHLTQKDPQFCGGGPGAEHCYTTGLSLHYFQTGNPDFKQTVIDLADWEMLALTGPQTLLAALKRGVDSLNRWRWSRGTMTLFPHYPLTRGTGNAITACLDSFEVGGGRKYLEQAADLILYSLHPDDDIACRDLLNAEIAWSYTVLLGAVLKFLDKKCELGEFDPSFAHARASLLAYADWMVEHEYPYLDKPEILEYPNETWAAQDLRKAVIFYQAARYSDADEQRQFFLERAHFFYEYAENELPKHQSSSFARPVVLMLQNGWVGDRLKENKFQPAKFIANGKLIGKPAPYLTLGNVIKRITSDLCQVLRKTSLKRELAWLKARLKP